MKSSTVASYWLLAMMSINLKLNLLVLSAFLTIFLAPKQLKSADREYGKYLSSECSACHATTGKSNAGIPSLNGKSFDYLTTALKEYKEKVRENSIMQMVADRLDNEQINALAAYFSSLK